MSKFNGGLIQPLLQGIGEPLHPISVAAFTNMV